MLISSLNGLFAFGAINNRALAGKELPPRLKLLNWGTNKSTKGQIIVGQKTAATLAANQRRFGYDRVGIDYNHQSLPGHTNFKPDPREMAAYGVPSVVPGEGLFLEDIAWTPSGKQYASNYSDLSPAPLLDSGEVTFLHSVALCPQGCVDGLTFLSATLPMIHQKTSAEILDELRKLAAKLFNLPETAPEDELLASGRDYVENLLREKNPVLALSAADLSVCKQLGLKPEAFAAPSSVTALSSTLSASDLLVCRQLGLNPEDFVK